MDLDLGEPLPLPYQVKKEEQEALLPPLEYEPIRKRRWRDVSDNEETLQSNTNVTIPKLLGYLNTRRDTSRGENTLPIDLIRQKVDNIRTIIDNNELHLDVKPLDDFEAQLKKDVDIMEELDKLQKFQHEMAPGVSYLKVTVVVLAAVVVMMGSFLLSGLNYDYCYYFC